MRHIKKANTADGSQHMPPRGGAATTDVQDWKRQAPSKKNTLIANKSGGNEKQKVTPETGSCFLCSVGREIFACSAETGRANHGCPLPPSVRLSYQHAKRMSENESESVTVQWNVGAKLEDMQRKRWSCGCCWSEGLVVFSRIRLLTWHDIEPACRRHRDSV